MQVATKKSALVITDCHTFTCPIAISSSVFVPCYSGAIVMKRIAQVDVWRVADVLVKQYGEDAAIIVAQRADALLDAIHQTMVDRRN